MATRLFRRFRPSAGGARRASGADGNEPLLDQHLMSSLQRLAVYAPRVQRGTFAGEHRSRRRGSSPEFADFKSYSPGDDIRRVDWNLYARFDELFVRLSEVTTDLTVHLLLDASASMDWRAAPGRPTKYRYAQKIAAALAYVALWHFDRIRVSPIARGDLPSFGPVQGRSNVPGLLAYLEDCQPGGDRTMTERLHDYAQRQSTPGLLVALTDLLSDEVEPFFDQCRALRGKGWDIALIHVVDPAELAPDLIFSGQDRSQPTTLIDAESGQRVMVLPTAAALLRYRSAVESWLADLDGRCRLNGVTYVRLATDLPVDSAALRLLNEHGLLT
jgi:uncharacterized protein (DUF58 family)